MDAGQLTAAAQDVADMCGRRGGRFALKANHPTCVLQRFFGFAAGIFATSALDRPSLRSRGICRGCCDAAARRRATTGPRRAADVRPSPERRQLRATPGDVGQVSQHHSERVAGRHLVLAERGQDKERHAVEVTAENPQHLEGRLVRPVHVLEKQQSRHGR